MHIDRTNEKYNASFRSTAKNSTKGSEFDTLNRQLPVRRQLDDSYIDNLLSSNELAKNLLTAPVEDSLKNNFEITFVKNGKEDIKLRDRVFEKIDELDFIEKLKELLVESRKRGYAMLYYVFNDSDNETKNEVNANSNMIGINVFTKNDISKIEFEKSKLKPNYNQITEVKIMDITGEMSERLEEVEIHPSRLDLAYQNRTQTEVGTTIFNQLIDRVIIQDTTEWSIGQLIYRAVFLKYKTDEATLEKLKKSGIDKKENEINTSTFAAIGSNDDIDAVNSTAGLDPEKYLNAAATILSMHSNIPKQRLMGNALGSIAGAEEDAKKYAEYLTRFFNTFAVPVINSFIVKILHELGEQNVSFEVYLDSLLEKDDLKEAQTEEAEAKATNQKLLVIQEAIKVMNKVGLNPDPEAAKELVGQIKTGEKLTGQHIAKLWDKANTISQTNLEIEKEQASVMSSKINAINTMSTTIQNTGYAGDKNKIAKIAKIMESENAFEDLMKLLGEEDVTDSQTRNREGNQEVT